MSTPVLFYLNESDVDLLRAIAKQYGLDNETAAMRHAISDVVDKGESRVVPKTFVNSDDTPVWKKQIRTSSSEIADIEKISRWVYAVANGPCVAALIKKEMVDSGAWKVNSKGHIWATKKKTRSGWREIARERCEMSTKGVSYVAATINKEQLTCRAADLVYCCIVKPIPVGSKVVHKNGNNQDNRPNNLSLSPDVLPSAAMRYAIRRSAMRLPGRVRKK